MNRIARPAIAGISLAIAIGTAYDMYARTAQELLWGHRPLLLFLAVWIAFHAIFSGRTPEGRHRVLLSSLSGLILGLGFPGILPAPLLLFAGFVPLLLLEEEISASDAKRKTREVFRHSYNTFILWNIISTYWVANTALAAGVVAMVLNSLFMAWVFMAFHATKRIMPRLGLAAFAAYWMAFDYVHLNWELTWPWLTIGNGLAQFPALAQWYEYTGVFGGSLWILTGNILVLAAWKARVERPVLRKQLFRLATWITLPVAISLWMYFNHTDEGTPITVAIVQPNYEPHYEKFEIAESIQMDRFIELSAMVTDSATDYLVWPETSFGYVETRAVEAYPAVQRTREFMAPFPRLKLIAGIDAYHIFLPGEPHSRAVRSSDRGDGNVMYYEVLNAAIQLSNESAETPLYRKSKLVPGPEILPYRELFGVFKPIIEQVQGTVSGVGTQKERATLSSSSGHIAPVICYESVFGEYFTGYIHKGAQAAFIMTNDGWWDDTPGHRQHLWFGTLRSIETRRSIARAANTGISAFINQRGDVLQPTRYGETIAIKGEILLNDRVTFYVRWGDVIARIAIFTSLLLLLNTLAKSIKARIGAKGN